jgi:hypothetical protein
MNKEFKYLLGFTLFLFCIGFNAKAQTIQAQAKLKDYTIKIGEQTKLFLEVHQPVKSHVSFPKLVDTISSKVQIVSVGKRDTAIDKANANWISVTQSYLITAFDAGTYTIPSYQFGYETGIDKSNEVSLQVQTVKVDTTKAIYDIKQPYAVSYSFFDWLRDNWYWVLLGLVIILLAIGITWYLKKRPKNIPIFREVKPVIPPHTIALDKLQHLRERKLWQQDEVKLYYSELSDVIREYLEKRYVVSTYEKTTDEILAALKYVGIAADKMDRLRQLLVMADLAKFAKEKPLPIENEQSMDNAINFVKTTQQAPEPAKPSEGGSTDELA